MKVYKDLKIAGGDVNVYENGDVLSRGELARALSGTEREARLGLSKLLETLDGDTGKPMGKEQFDSAVTLAVKYINEFLPYSVVLPQYNDIIATCYNVVAKCEHVLGQDKEMEALNKIPQKKVSSRGVDQWNAQKDECMGLLNGAQSSYQKSVDAYEEAVQVGASTQESVDEDDVKAVKDDLNGVADQITKLNGMQPHVSRFNLFSRA